MTTVPFFRPELRSEEIDEVVATLKEGWLTTGPRTRLFEERFAQVVGASHAVAVNSCTAALHLAVEALGLRRGDAVLVPTMTFAATAEVVRYAGAIPILVDCDPVTGNIDMDDAERKLAALRAGQLTAAAPADAPLVGVMPVHVGGFMVDMNRVSHFAQAHGLWVVEDAAHALPAAWRPGPVAPWRRAGEGTADVTCFSFYANKTMTTGEGGMAVCPSAVVAERMRLMSLHGLSRDAWSRYTAKGAWDYRIVAPGYKYNLTDIAAAIGLHQLARAEDLRRTRERIAREFIDALSDVEEIELPPESPDRVHAWHLFPIRCRLERLTTGRNEIFERLRRAGIVCSVHWRPLHLHPYYSETGGWQPSHCPVASEFFERNISLPLFPSMRADEIRHVVRAVRTTLRRLRRRGAPDPPVRPDPPALPVSPVRPVLPDPPGLPDSPVVHSHRAP